MKKLFVIALSVGAFIGMASCSKENNDLPITEQSEKNVKSGIDSEWSKILSVYQYSEDYSEELSRTENRYDDDMLLINVKTYLKGALYNEQTDYSYKGTNVKFNSYSYEPNGSGKHTITTYEYQYKDNTYNKWLSQSVYINGPEYRRQENRYDASGKQIGHKSYTYNSMEQSADSYVYDGNKLTFYDSEYNSDGFIFQTYKNEVVFYNADSDIDKIVSRIRYLGDGEEIEREEYSYDEYGRKIGHSSYRNGKLYSETMNYLYDDDKNELTFDTHIHFDSGIEVRKSKIEYLKP